MDDDLYDIVVIGGGPAGTNAATTAHGLGAKVLLVEGRRMGGTCLNCGCDPTLALAHVAAIAAQSRSAGRYGLRVPTVDVDWAAVRQRVRDVQRAVQGADSDEHARDQKRAEGIDVEDHDACFISPTEVRVGDRVVRARGFVVATGTTASAPGIQGLEEAGYLTYADVHELPELPARVCIIGGDPLGVEFAQLFARLASEVTLVERGERPLSAEEPELVDLLCDYLDEDGVTLLRSCIVGREDRRGGARVLTIEHDGGRREELEVDELLVLSGRTPNTGSLGLEAAGVDVRPDGSIIVDDMLRTSAGHVHAAGDVLGQRALQYTHVASAMGRVAARNALVSGAGERFNFDAIPRSISTEPQLARLGATEGELRDAGTEYETLTTSLDDMTVPLATFTDKGGVKLLVDGEGLLLGAHILAPNAGDLMAPLALLMRNDLPVDLLERTLLPFPNTVGAVRTAATQFSSGT